jgi:hypothetical protein
MQERIEISRQSSPTPARDQLAYMVCGLWMVTGLYIDGWAHQADKPETFFTPWHGVLYSGFLVAVAYSLVAGARNGGRSRPRVEVGDDRITALGLAVFIAGALGDFVWHAVAGIEADIEALISPTHLMLMIGGLMMVTLPVRAALDATRKGRAIEPGERLAVIVSVGLSLAVVLFFLMYLSPWAEGEWFHDRYVPDDTFSNMTVHGSMAALLVTAALFCGALLWTARRWTLPFGAATVMFTAVAFGQSGLEGFDLKLPILAATAAGLVADTLLRAAKPLTLVGAATGATLTAAYFVLYHLEDTLGWSASLWAGAIVFSGLAGYAAGLAVSALAVSPAPAPRAETP